MIVSMDLQVGLQVDSTAPGWRCAASNVGTFSNDIGWLQIQIGNATKSYTVDTVEIWNVDHVSSTFSKDYDNRIAGGSVFLCSDPNCRSGCTTIPIPAAAQPIYTLDDTQTWKPAASPGGVRNVRTVRVEAPDKNRLNLQQVKVWGK